MTFEQAIKAGFSGYFQFSGRASRSAFWYWVLFTILAGFVLGLIDSFLGLTGVYGTGVLGGLFNLAVFVPSISVAVRRLHDVDRSGWWYWLFLIPLIGWAVLIYWYITKGTDGGNEYGEDPLQPSSERIADVFE